LWTHCCGWSGEKLEHNFGETSVIEEDPSDNIYLECAIESGADFIISGDHHLTDFGTYEGIRIMNPATFLKIIQSEK